LPKEVPKHRSRTDLRVRNRTNCTTLLANVIGAVAHGKAGVVKFFNGPWWREATSGHSIACQNEKKPRRPREVPGLLATAPATRSVSGQTEVALALSLL